MYEEMHRNGYRFHHSEIPHHRHGLGARRIHNLQGISYKDWDIQMGAIGTNEVEERGEMRRAGAMFDLSSAYPSGALAQGDMLGEETY